MQTVKSQFITVHDEFDNHVMAINVNQIVYVSECFFYYGETVKRITSIRTIASEFAVKEKLSEIMYEICGY